MAAAAMGCMRASMAAAAMGCMRASMAAAVMACNARIYGSSSNGV